jgi:hypothetical protein
MKACVPFRGERQGRFSWAWCKPALLLAFGLLGATGAYAHLMSAGAGAVNLRLQDATVLIGVPVSVLQGVDDDGDGLLQPQEVKAHRTEILAQLARGFSLSVGGQVAEVREAYLMVSVHAEDGVSTPQVEWWSLLAFKEPVAPTDCAEITVQWFPVAGKAAPDITYSLQFRHGEQAQSAVFTSTNRHQKLRCASGTPQAVQ